MSPPPCEPFDPDLLDDEDPFEIDDGNRPHLASHAPYTEHDVWDVWESEPEFFPAKPSGSADWLLVARVPGRICLTVPLAPPNSGDPSQCRPIGVYESSAYVTKMYDDAWTN